VNELALHGVLRDVREHVTSCLWIHRDRHQLDSRLQQLLYRLLHCDLCTYTT